MKSKIIITITVILFSLIGFLSILSENKAVNPNKLNISSYQDSIRKDRKSMYNKIVKSEEEWKKELTADQYYVLRQKGTEHPFTGEYYNHKEKGIYKCAACDNILFESDSKFDSDCGWPSYFSPLAEDRVIYREDYSHGMIRTEVICAKCEGHLGHVFEDGPAPTGLRYCINSVSLKFEKKID